jgi:hypothetical protein
MKRKEMFLFGVIIGMTAIIAFFVSGMIFSAPKGRVTQIPNVVPLTTSLPDLKNDPSYKAFLNSSALDATQPVSIGQGSENTNPFNASQ